VILGHEVIPHHHHVDMFPEADTECCPHNTQEHPDSDHHPVHCHAFNELAFYKTSLPGTSQPVVVPTLFSAGVDPAGCMNIELALTGIKHPQNTLPSFILFGRSALLRGPPIAG